MLSAGLPGLGFVSRTYTTGQHVAQAAHAGRAGRFCVKATDMKRKIGIEYVPEMGGLLRVVRVTQENDKGYAVEIYRGPQGTKAILNRCFKAESIRNDFIRRVLPDLVRT